MFFYNILVYSGSIEQHLQHLQTTFQVLLANQFVLKLSKCLFAQSQVEYLGHMVSHQRVEPVALKITAIHQCPQPRSIKALRSFLGLEGFYRRFIRGYATIAAPLVKVTAIDPFHWTLQAQLAFDNLKHALSTVPVLALPDFKLPFTVETDASGVGMGASSSLHVCLRALCHHLDGQEMATIPHRPPLHHYHRPSQLEGAFNPNYPNSRTTYVLGASNGIRLHYSISFWQL